jgi:FixJ family two-component response regulator
MHACNGLSGGERAGWRETQRDFMADGLLIAVVDDDMSIRNATQDLLRAAGFSTAAFSNATSFLDSPIRENVGCLVADMRMPGMTGIELHEHLAASGSGIPTVIVTAHPGELSGERIREAGITCFLIKPFAPDALLQCVRNALASFKARRTIPRS